LRNFRISCRHLLILGGLCLIGGCQKPPTAELQQAETAFSDAVKAEADQYSEESFVVAKSALDNAKSLLEQKLYEPAREAALKAKEAFESAKVSAVSAKNEAQKSSEQLLIKLKKKMSELKQHASRSKGKTKKESQEKIKELEVKLSDAERDFKSGLYRVSLKSLQAIDQEIDSLVDSLKSSPIVPRKTKVKIDQKR